MNNPRRVSYRSKLSDDRPTRVYGAQYIGCLVCSCFNMRILAFLNASDRSLSDDDKSSKVSDIRVTEVSETIDQ